MNQIKQIIFCMVFCFTVTIISSSNAAAPISFICASAEDDSTSNGTKAQGDAFVIDLSGNKCNGPFGQTDDNFNNPPLQAANSLQIGIFTNPDTGGTRGILLKFGNQITNVVAPGFVGVDPGEFAATTADPVNTTVTFEHGGNSFKFTIIKNAISNTIEEFTVSQIVDPSPIITSFLLNRANHILANNPDLIGLLNGNGAGGGNGGSLGNLALNGNEDGMELAFSASLSKLDRTESKAINDRIALAFAKNEDAQGGEGVEAIEAISTYETPTRKYDVWTEVHGSQGSSGTSDSSFWVGYLGAHYFVTPDLIIGGLAQFDWADESDATTGSSADGNGWMIGPYMAGRVAGTSISYEARASWGRSDNNISPDGTFTDSFDTERWLASGKISGSFMMDEVNVKPSVEISYFHETQETYVDGNSDTIAEQTVSLGELRFGPQFSRAIKLDNGNTVEPSLGVAGVWSFGVSGAADPSGFTLGNSDLRARVEGGISTTNSLGWRLTASAYYDGLGIDDFEALGGKVRLTIPLN